MAIFDDVIDWKAVKGSIINRERITDDCAPAIKDDLTSSIEIAKSLAAPRSITLNIPVESAFDSSLILSGGVAFTGKRLIGHIKNARGLILFLVTIGPDIEETASRLMKEGDGLSGYLMDRIGSFAVEYLAESLEDRIRREHTAKDLSVSMRCSPGYCDWPIEEQLKLDGLIGYDKIGVRLNESLMMTPKKSISGLIAIGDKGTFDKKTSQCGQCDMKRCDYRRG